MAKQVIYLENTGLVIGTVTFDWAKKLSDSSNVSTAAATLTERGGGYYIVDFTVTEDTDFKVHETADNTKYAVGIMSNIDGNISVFDSTTDEVDIGKVKGVAVTGIADFYGLTGPSTVTLTIEETDTTAIGSAYCVIKNLSGDTLWTGLSNGSGIITFTAPDDAYKVVLNKVQVNFAAEEDLTVSGDTAQTYNGTVLSVPSPGSAESVIIHEDLRGQDDSTFPASVDFTAQIVDLPYDFNGTLHKGDLIDGTYNPLTGRITWDIAKGAKVKFREGSGQNLYGMDKTITIPTADARLSDISNV